MNRDLGHHWSALLPRFARLQRKVAPYGRVKPLASRRARCAAFALSGVQSAESCEQGHKTTSPDTQERSFARGQTRIAHHQNRFWQFGADADGALSAYPAPRLGQYSSKHCENNVDHRCGRGEAKPRRISTPSAPTHSEHCCCERRRCDSSTISQRGLIAAAPADETAASRAPAAQAARALLTRRPWARKKKRMTSPRPST